MAYCLFGFRPAGNILTITLILSKNPDEPTEINNERICDCWGKC